MIKKIWGLSFVIILLSIFGLIILGGSSSENKDDILSVIESLDSQKVTSISIEPTNVEWKINLLVDTLIINDNRSKQEFILALKSLKQKSLTKGIKRNWECRATINLNKTFKDKTQISLIIYDTADGLYLELTNVMGYQTYFCPSLKPILETLTNFHTPRMR